MVARGSAAADANKMGYPIFIAESPGRSVLLVELLVRLQRCAPSYESSQDAAVWFGGTVKAEFYTGDRERRKHILREAGSRTPRQARTGLGDPRQASRVMTEMGKPHRSQ